MPNDNDELAAAVASARHAMTTDSSYIEAMARKARVILERADRVAAGQARMESQAV